jgi:putative ABC transport system permease protein
MRRRSRFRGLFGLDPKGDVEDELSFHIEMRISELTDRGVPFERARELALRRFGDYESSRIQCVAIDERRGLRMSWMVCWSELRQDVAYALRMLRRSPAFTAVAIATLALGIGANSAIFSVVHGVLLRSLPFKDADRLHFVRMLYPDGTTYTMSAPDFMSVREETRTLEQVEAYANGVFTLLGRGEPREFRGANVSDGLFSLLGLNVGVGRGFVREEHQPGRGTAIILDHAFWLREFGGDRTVPGLALSIAGRLYTIVGVLAPGARLPIEADMYAPIEYRETFSATTATGRRSEFLAVVGRARAGTTPQQVDEDLRRIGAELQKTFPQTNGALTITARGLRDTIVGDVRGPLLMLLGAVGFVLLVACANVANLLLARASARQGELAVRAALGAGRGRLLRQLLTEAGVLALAGCALGLAMAYWGTRALVAAQPADVPRLNDVGVNGTVMLFTFALAVLTSVLFGIVPALHATGGRLTRSLREGGRGGLRGHRARSTLVVAEMALAVVLLTGAGLLIRSFVHLTRVPPGFEPGHAMAFRIPMQGDAYQRPEQIRSRMAQFDERLRALPGVTAVAATTVLPLSGLSAILGFSVEGAPPPPPNVNAEIAVASVTPDYFRAIGVQLLRGRGFTPQDHTNAPPVVVINEAAVRRWFPGQDPLGKRVNIGGPPREVVGIVRDVLQWNPGEPVAPQLFAAYAQRTARTVRIVVRTAGDPLALAGPIRAQIRALDADLAIGDFVPLEDLVTRSVAQPRFYTSLLALFAAVALGLAGTGMFGVMSYLVAQRAREISIRIALGAYVGDVLRMIVGRAIALAGLGALIGISASLAVGRVIQEQLFGVRLLDPVTIAAVTLLLIVIAVLASFLPARRAAGLDPARALRDV